MVQMRKNLIPGIGLSLLIALLIPPAANSQTKVLDSLQNALVKQKTDTGKVNTMLNLANYYDRIQDFDKTVNYATEAIRLAASINYKKGLTRGYQLKAFTYSMRRQTGEALSNYVAALGYAKEDNDQFDIGIIQYQIAVAHFSEGNYTEALKNCLASLKYLEGLKNNLPLGGVYMLIAHIYSSYENYGESIRYFYLSLKVYESKGFKDGITNVLQEIGKAYFALGNFHEAAKKFSAMLAMYQADGNRNGVATASRSLGEALAEQGNYREALNIQLEALKVYRDTTMWSRIGLPYMLNSIGRTYEMQGDIETDKTKRVESYNAALQYLNEAIAKWEKSTSPPNLADAYIRVAQN
jgi:tetratricopeptide (TPR) repeat protein